MEELGLAAGAGGGGGGGPEKRTTLMLGWSGEHGREGRKRVTVRPRAARWRESSVAGKVWPLEWKGTTTISPAGDISIDRVE